MKVKNRMAWEKFRAANSGPYEEGILKFSERWAVRMEKRLTGSVGVGDVAEATITDPILRPTNLQLASAIVALVAHWEHGEALKCWHGTEWQAVKARRGE